MKGKFVIGKRILDNETKHHWKTLNIAKFKPEKPIVLIFGGSGTDDNKTANGNAKIVQNLLGSLAEDVDILTVNYNEGDRKIGQIADNCTNLIEHLFLPLLSEKGKKLDIETACKNIRKITIFTHCFGDLRVDDLLNLLKIELHQLSYSKQEQNKIFSQIFVITYGILSGVPNHFKDVPVFNVLSPEDEFWIDKTMFWRKLVENMDNLEISAADKRALTELAKNSAKGQVQFEKFYDKNQRCFVVRDKNRLGLACSGLEENFWEDHNLALLNRNTDWSKSPTSSAAGDYVSRCVACALCNSVANSLINQKSETFVPFVLEQLQAQMEEFVRTLNKPFEADPKEQKGK